MTQKRSCDVRRVPPRAILDKLRQCQDAGVDVDRIPLSLTVKDLLRMPVSELAMLAENHGAG